MVRKRVLETIDDPAKAKKICGTMPDQLKKIRCKKYCRVNKYSDRANTNFPEKAFWTTNESTVIKVNRRKYKKKSRRKSKKKSRRKSRKR